jgi:hypothetical protein
MHPDRQDFQESHCFQGLLIALYALYDHLGYTILGDDQWLSMFAQLPYNFGGMGLQVTNGLDLTGQFQEGTSILKI